MSRQKAAHKSAKASEVKAVGATGQCGEPRVAEEGGGGGAGGMDTVRRERGKLLSEQVFSKRAPRYLGLKNGGDVRPPFLTVVNLTIVVPDGVKKPFEIAFTGTRTVALILQFLPFAVLCALPVEIRQDVEQHRRNAHKDEGTGFFLTWLSRPCGLIFVIFGRIWILEDAIIRVNKRFQSVGQLSYWTTGLPGEPCLQLAQLLFTDTGTVVPNMFKVPLEGLEVGDKDFERFSLNIISPSRNLFHLPKLISQVRNAFAHYPQYSSGNLPSILIQKLY
ncbi:uncharacterized protein BcabD6B2_28280 [Babesia caballi]|uniref:Uncharacterized protein n=1 Tax=Babesia caballi TaxID=5871 RepID=A0AAV4LUG6_BABCB|nr:hypothetical protein, conserved [Babesia caballi]